MLLCHSSTTKISDSIRVSLGRRCSRCRLFCAPSLLLLSLLTAVTGAQLPRSSKSGQQAAGLAPAGELLLHPAGEQLSAVTRKPPGAKRRSAL